METNFGCGGLLVRRGESAGRIKVQRAGRHNPGSTGLVRADGRTLAGDALTGYGKLPHATAGVLVTKSEQPPRGLRVTIHPAHFHERAEPIFTLLSADGAQGFVGGELRTLGHGRCGEQNRDQKKSGNCFHAHIKNPFAAFFQPGKRIQERRRAFSAGGRKAISQAFSKA